MKKNKKSIKKKKKAVKKVLKKKKAVKKVLKKKKVVKKTIKKKKVASKKKVEAKKTVKKFVAPKMPQQSNKKVNNRIINPSHYQTKKVKKYLEIKTIKEKKVKKIFKLNDYVVYPTHGVGKIVDIEKREVVGQKLEMYVIRYPDIKMDQKVPVHKAKENNLRAVSKPSKIQAVLKVLGQKAKIKRTMWSRRAQEYDLKINSGEIEQIAEVVRDLNRANNQIEQSYSERQLFELSYDRFLREVIASLKITEENAIKKIDKILGRDKLKNAPSLLN
jgi:CarD family transcriptional regulator